ncbi:MAG: hypothetical protein F6K23_22840 [Okeania sp. SIO2C9]|uniref:hypothetical protein n=1 Tax=Okeania sp. SIO2C9 TaxID=2607791 RepID=UPI0013C16784|nr:hypothetical protein [Okeania sp. SIO2C9]NEQ75633.1 hypothetical protein [Okeania sp. SIO2C9]
MNKQKKLYLPLWFPCPSSWLKALIMVYFITILVAVIKDLKLGIYFWQQLQGSLELFICLSIIFLFCLIPVFAFLHHYFILIFHAFRQILDRSYRYNFFLFPPITSWWKALYSWLIIVISTLAATLIYTLILPWFNLNYQIAILEKSQFLDPETFIERLLLFVFISVWLIVAAKLYQFEFLSKKNFVLNKIYSPSPIIKNKKFSKQTQINLHKTENEHELAKASIYYGVTTTNKPKSVLAKNKANKAKQIHQIKKNNYLQKIQKTIKKNILVLLIIPLLALGVYGFSQWQLMSEKSVVIVPEIPSPIAKKVNSENLEIEEVKTKPTPIYSPTEKPLPTPKITLVLPPPDPFKLAVNRAISAAEMAQSAQTKIEWEAVASQWQDATEFMKIVPAFHPKYKQARKKIIEYQGYADYAIRVAKMKK